MAQITLEVFLMLYRLMFNRGRFHAVREMD